MKLCVVQEFIPLYSISFFNKIKELYPEVDLVVLANVVQKNPLNQIENEYCSFEIVQADAKHFRGMIWRKGLFKILQKQKADVVIFSGATRDLSQLLVMGRYWITGVKFGAWGMFHRIGGPTVASKIYCKLVGFFAAKCLTYTRVGAVNLMTLGVPKDKISIVGTAIDEQRPEKAASLISATELIEFRKSHQLEGKKIILQVVRLSKVKSPELLIQAAAILTKVRQDLLFILIGDGEMRIELEALVAKNNLKSNVRFIGALFDELKLAKWYLSSDIFVVPTFLGLSAHHAMSYGLPVVTDSSLNCQGSEYELVAEGLNGMSYKEGSASDLAQIINKLLNNDELRKFMSFNARMTIKNRHNLENKTRNFIEQAKLIAGLIE